MSYRAVRASVLAIVLKTPFHGLYYQNAPATLTSGASMTLFKVCTTSRIPRFLVIDLLSSWELNGKHVRKGFARD